VSVRKAAALKRERKARVTFNDLKRGPSTEGKSLRQKQRVTAKWRAWKAQAAKDALEQTQPIFRHEQLLLEIIAEQFSDAEQIHHGNLPPSALIPEVLRRIYGEVLKLRRDNAALRKQLTKACAELAATRI
jgi:hypothetical protein